MRWFLRRAGKSGGKFRVRPRIDCDYTTLAFVRKTAPNLDVPGFAVGDLFYLRKLSALLESR